MPTRNLTNDENFQSLVGWLNENLIISNSFVPHLDPIPNVNSKGIYFWFMRPDGYNALSNYVRILPIELKYTKDIDGINYDLVYLGTAGTGKKGNSNITERFEWHVNQNHNISNICHGTLSTLRAGIGAMVSNDLILPNTEDTLNSFMTNYMRVFWINYPDDNYLINNDEQKIIKEIKPIFNLKNNPNARASALTNSTQNYKIRRTDVYKDTRLRIECKGESEQSKKNKIPTKDSLSFAHQLYSSENSYFEFFVLKNQSILDVTRGIDGLPKEACTFQILNSKTGLPVEEFKNWKLTGRNIMKNPKAQNIYTYFSAPGGKIEGKYTARWILIQKRMNKIKDQIEEITVKVFSTQKFINNKVNDYKNSLTRSKNIDNKIEELNWSKLNKKNVPKLLIIGCCDAKYLQPYNLANGERVNYNFGDALNNSREERMRYYQTLNANYFNGKKRGGHAVNKQYFMNALNNDNRNPALDVYGSNHSPFYKPSMKELFRQKIKYCNLHLLIVSGLYGIIRYNDYINDYHLEITKGPNVWGNIINNAVSTYIQVNNIDNNSVFYSLSDKYLPFLNPLPHWNNLWLTHGSHGHNQAQDLMIFLNNLRTD